MAVGRIRTRRVSVAIQAISTLEHKRHSRGQRWHPKSEALSHASTSSVLLAIVCRSAAKLWADVHRAAAGVSATKATMHTSLQCCALHARLPVLVCEPVSVCTAMLSSISYDLCHTSRAQPAVNAQQALLWIAGLSSGCMLFSSVPKRPCNLYEYRTSHSSSKCMSTWSLIAGYCAQGLLQWQANTSTTQVAKSRCACFFDSEIDIKPNCRHLQRPGWQRCTSAR